MRRYYRGVSKKVQKAIKEAKKAKRVLGWPEKVTCDCCYKQIDFDKAERRLGGIGFGRGSYYICKSHI